VIIPAYLPVEKNVILDTLDYFLSIPYPGLQIYLAYNTNKPLAIERKLKNLEKINANLTIIKVRGSQTKAENLNAALKYIDTDFVGIFDADHKPEKDIFDKVDYYFQNTDYHAIQGRAISLSSKTLLSKLVSLDVDQMYGINHFARELLYDFAFFGGSNGFWRTYVLKCLTFNPHMLTEDIDISIRALKRGYKIKYIREFISYELPPKNMEAFLKQRTRWAQGWLQATLVHTIDILKSKNLQIKQKFGILFNLPIRELRTYLITQIFAIAFAFGFRTHYWEWIDSPYFIIFIIITTINTIEPAFVFMARNKSLRRRWIILFSIFNPIYLYILHSTTLMAMVRMLMKINVFEVTEKQKPILLKNVL